MMFHARRASGSIRSQNGTANGGRFEKFSQTNRWAHKTVLPFHDAWRPQHISKFKIKHDKPVLYGSSCYFRSCCSYHLSHIDNMLALSWIFWTSTVGLSSQLADPSSTKSRSSQPHPGENHENLADFLRDCCVLLYLPPKDVGENMVGFFWFQESWVSTCQYGQHVDAVCSMSQYAVLESVRLLCRLYCRC